MHGSLIDSHHRSSLNGNRLGTLSSSEHMLADDEQINNSSNDIHSLTPSDSIPVRRSIASLHNIDENEPTNIIIPSTDFFRWTRGHRRVMLTFCTICLFAFMTGIEYAVILPTVFDYVKTMASDNIYVGLTLSCYSISGSIVGMIMGIISDMTGRVKFLIIICSVFEVAGNILYCIGKDIRRVLLGRLIAGVGMGAVPSILADIAHRTTENDRTKAISIILGCRQLGLLIGPCFTLLISLMNFNIGPVHVYNLNGPGFLMATIWLILIVVCWFCFYDRTTNPISSSLSNGIHSIIKSDRTSEQEKQKVSFKTYRDQYIRIEIFVLFLTTFITYFNQTALETIVTSFAETNFKWKTVHTSILFAVGGLEIIFVYIALVKIISKRFEDRNILIFGLISLTFACMIGTFFTWASHSLHWFGHPNPTVVNKPLLTLFILFVIFDLLSLPFIAVTSVSILTKLTIKELQGFSQGIQRLIMGIGTIVGPLFASSLLQRLHIMMTVMLILTILTLIAICIVIKRLRPLSKNLPSNDIENIHNNNHNLSSKNDNNEIDSTMIISSKNSYVTLIQHDDDLSNKNFKSKSPKKHLSNHNSNGEIQNQSFNSHKQ
ncbi:unnamed protein product [Adineta steineri]|uniref:Major facilitator superfamily (MFS) profile domain-containing protein n=1 Tax=Adineta steineri TaxID=433720 RepID=A0A816CIL9_9BILA|nr:unnamed protein product [Adineta steineri]CAF1423582.1 unnamed protein product [Adineta steineri]CAF1621784.1 unnamed protein product [Adineta steineri]